MAITVLDNPVLFGMRLGSELDQLRQSAMAQAISQSLREALDLHTWRYGMLANLLAAYHRAQSPAERAAYAALIAPLAEAAQAPKEQETVVPGVGVRIGYLPAPAISRVLSGGAVQNRTAPQRQQDGAAQSNQQQPTEQQTAVPQPAATAQPVETRKLTKEELQAILEALALVDPLYGLVHHRLQTSAQQATVPEQQAEGAVQPMQQQLVEEQGTEQPIWEDRLLAPPDEQVEGTVQPIQRQPVEQLGAQQPQGTLGGILQQQPNQQQLATPAQPSQQPEGYEHTGQAVQMLDWSRIVPEATDQVLSIVFPWYHLVKNNPRWRQALSGFLQVDLEKMSQSQQRRP